MAQAKTLEVRGIPIRYEEFGSGRPALFIHGVSIDRRSLVAELEPAFAGRSGWRRLYPDLPGRGETPGADWIESQDDMLEVALAFLDAVAPHERAVVGGTSWGGYIALGMVHQRAAQLDGALFIVSNPLRVGRTVPEHRVFEVDEALVASLDEAERQSVGLMTSVTREAVDRHRALFAPAIAALDEAFVERVEARTTFTFDLHSMPAFDRPSLVISARQDAMAGYSDMLGLIETFPRATWAILDRAGHGVAGEQPELFRALVAEWLDRVEAEG